MEAKRCTATIGSGQSYSGFRPIKKRKCSNKAKLKFTHRQCGRVSYRCLMHAMPLKCDAYDCTDLEGT